MYIIFIELLAAIHIKIINTTTRYSPVVPQPCVISFHNTEIFNWGIKLVNWLIFKLPIFIVQLLVVQELVLKGDVKSFL